MEYLIEFTIPSDPHPSFYDLIPAQRMKIDQYMQDGIVLSYTLNANRTRLWVVVRAAKAKEVEDLIDSLPLSDFMTFKTHELLFHHAAENSVPKFSLN